MKKSRKRFGGNEKIITFATPTQTTRNGTKKKALKIMKMSGGKRHMDRIQDINYAEVFN